MGRRDRRKGRIREEEAPRTKKLLVVMREGAKGEHQLLYDRILADLSRNGVVVHRKLVDHDTGRKRACRIADEFRHECGNTTEIATILLGYEPKRDDAVSIDCSCVLLGHGTQLTEQSFSQLTTAVKALAVKPDGKPAGTWARECIRHAEGTKPPASEGQTARPGAALGAWAAGPPMSARPQVPAPSNSGTTAPGQPAASPISGTADAPAVSLLEIVMSHLPTTVAAQARASVSPALTMAVQHFIEDQLTARTSNSGGRASARPTAHSSPGTQARVDPTSSSPMQARAVTPTAPPEAVEWTSASSGRRGKGRRSTAGTPRGEGTTSQRGTSGRGGKTAKPASAAESGSAKGQSASQAPATDAEFFAGVKKQANGTPDWSSMSRGQVQYAKTSLDIPAAGAPADGLQRFLQEYYVNKPHGAPKQLADGLSAIGRRPIFTSGSGNQCMFRAVSQAICGHDGLTSELETATRSARDTLEALAKEDEDNILEELLDYPSAKAAILSAKDARHREGRLGWNPMNEAGDMLALSLATGLQINVYLQSTKGGARTAAAHHAATYHSRRQVLTGGTAAPAAVPVVEVAYASNHYWCVTSLTKDPETGMFLSAGMPAAQARALVHWSPKSAQAVPLLPQLLKGLSSLVTPTGTAAGTQRQFNEDVLKLLRHAATAKEAARDAAQAALSAASTALARARALAAPSKPPGRSGKDAKDPKVLAAEEAEKAATEVEKRARSASSLASTKMTSYAEKHGRDLEGAPLDGRGADGHAPAGKKGRTEDGNARIPKPPSSDATQGEDAADCSTMQLPTAGTKRAGPEADDGMGAMAATTASSGGARSRRSSGRSQGGAQGRAPDAGDVVMSTVPTGVGPGRPPVPPPPPAAHTAATAAVGATGMPAQ